jgi:DNA processing protein
MITVDMALEQGRDVYALPGRLVASQSAGCNYLIKQGAAPIIDIAEFCDNLLHEARQNKEAVAPPPKKRHRTRAAPAAKRSFSPDEALVYAALDFTPYPLERIASACPQLARDRLIRILVTFCLKGVARQMGAGNYCLMDE